MFLDFDLPHDLIAQHPVEPRDRSRLMVIDRGKGTWEHRVFADLPDLLDPRDVLVRNDTRRGAGAAGGASGGHRRPLGGPLPPRAAGRRLGGDVPDARPPGDWRGRGRRQGPAAHPGGPRRAGCWIVRPISGPGPEAEDTRTLLDRHGQTPLPPYIRRGRESAGDRQAYQTVYARRPGSAAAPTAGLHFTGDVLERLAGRGIGCVNITLHVGPGTFRPITAERLEDHVMHAEWAELSAEAVGVLEARRGQGGRIVAVGTTSARTLETAAIGGRLRPFAGETRLFIRPGHAFRGLDALITNFHLPRSSLLVLVGAFAGTDLIRDAYAEAIRCRYRFFSYGDAMMIL